MQLNSHGCTQVFGSIKIRNKTLIQTNELNIKAKELFSLIDKWNPLLKPSEAPLNLYFVTMIQEFWSFSLSNMSRFAEKTHIHIHTHMHTYRHKYVLTQAHTQNCYIF